MNVERVGGVHLFSTQKHLKRARFADQFGQTLRATPPGDDAEGCTAVSEDRVRSGDAMRTGQRKVETSAHTKSLDGSEGRRRIFGDGIHQCLSHGREFTGRGCSENCNIADVGSRGKVTLVAGDDKRLWIGIEIDNRRC